MKSKIEDLIEEYEHRLSGHYKEFRNEKDKEKRIMHASYIASYGLVTSELKEILEGVQQ